MTMPIGVAMGRFFTLDIDVEYKEATPDAAGFRHFPFDKFSHLRHIKFDNIVQTEVLP